MSDRCKVVGHVGLLSLWSFVHGQEDFIGRMSRTNGGIALVSSAQTIEQN